MSNIIQLNRAPRSSRPPRSPAHHANLVFKPWQLVPQAIAPVLPGETMKSASLQARIVSDPVKNPMVGWWSEWWMFYVKLSDLDDREHFENMILKPDWDNSPVVSSTPNLKTYFNGRGQVDWFSKIDRRVIDTFFRDEGDIGQDFAIDGRPSIKINNNGWWQSVISDASYEDYDVDVDIDQDGVINASEVENAMQQYELLRMNGLVDMTYEDYLKSWGIRGSIVEEVKPHKPELVRYERDWAYPANTIDPATGTPSSALSWSNSWRADKDRFFTEPGFLVSYMAVRPKVYLGNITSHASGMMSTLQAWLHPQLGDHPLSGLIPVLKEAGALQTVGDDYWVDIRDLFQYGDQFINHTTDAANLPKVALPASDFQRQFATLTDANALFASPDAATFRSDSVLQLRIAGRTRENTAPQNRQVLI